MKTRRVALHTSMLVLALAITGVALPAAAPAHAQQASEAAELALEDIIVTARRREERLQETPVAVTAFSAQALEQRSISDIAGIAFGAPNITLKGGANSGGGNNTQIFIRGVGQDDFLPTADPGVGVYVDGVYLGRSVGGLLKTADIERVEILRGPQGTLFGRNTIGGAINITTKAPDFEALGGNLEGIVGNDDLYAVNGALTGPFSDKLAARIAFSYRNRGGYGRSTAAPGIDFGNEDYGLVRGKLAFRATDALQITLSGDYYKQSQNNTPVFTYVANTSPTSLIGLYNAFIGSAPGGLLFTPALFGDLDEPGRSTATGPSQDDSEVWGLGLTADWDISDQLNFKSITAYRKLKARFKSDSDGSAARIADTDDDYRQEQFSQELQLGFNFEKLRGIFGLYYFHEKGRDINDVRITPGLYSILSSLPVNLPAPGTTNRPVPCGLQSFFPIPGTPFRAPPPGFGLGCANNIANVGLDNELLVDQTITVDTFAAYAQASYQLTEPLSFTAGLRIMYEKKGFKYFQLRQTVSQQLGAPFYTVPPSDVSDNWTRLSPRAGFEYKFSDDAMGYFTYSRGFKSGTFNGRATDTQGVASVGPETLDQFEVGVKSEWLDRRVRFNLAGFYSLYDGIQLQSVQQDPVRGLLINLVNADAEVYGLEAELTARPVPAFEFGGTLGYTKSKITDIAAAAIRTTGVRPGNKLKKAPEWNASLYGQYTVPLDWGDLALRLDYSYTGKQFHDAANNVWTIEDAYSLLNMRIAFTTADERWQVAFYANNLTDQAYYNSLFQTGGGQGVAYPARGLDLGGSIKFNF
jgi:iron complex outermembrane recepter protein